MDWGMENRLARLFSDRGRCLFLPIDHGYFQGPTTALERPGETIKPLLPFCDALFVTRGVLRQQVPARLAVPIILRVSGGTSVVGGDLAREALTTSLEEIIRLNVAAVGVSIFVGSDYEKETLVNLANLVNQCENCGIPVMAVTAVGRELEKRDARYLALACRIAAELGARVVKTYWCENFDRVAQGCPAPVVLAGGPKCETAGEVLSFVHDGLSRGAVGVNLGRNIWQSPNPVAMIRALRGIVHEGLSVHEAEELYDDLTRECPGPAPAGTCISGEGGG